MYGSKDDAQGTHPGNFQKWTQSHTILNLHHHSLVILGLLPFTNKSPSNIYKLVAPSKPIFLKVVGSHITAELFLDFLAPQAMPLAQGGHMGPK